MKDRFAITIHLTNANKAAVQEAADLHGLSIKAFIENVLPYVAKQLKNLSNGQAIGDSQ